MISIFRYLLLTLIVLLLGALVWWYFFLGAKQDSLEAIDAGRGSGVAAPSFGNAIGSTYDNIVSSISSLVTKATGKPEESSTVPRLWQVTKTPVAGASFIQHGTSSAIRFVERGTGYVLEANPETEALARLTNTLVPRVYEALIGANGSIILRSIDDTGNIVTSAGQITAASTSTDSTPKTLATRRLPQNIRTIALHPEGEEILYLDPESAGESSVVRAAWNGTGVRRIGNLGIRGWQVQWLSDNRIILTQNAGGGSTYAYEFKENGALSQITSAAPNLAVLPHPNSSALLYSNSAGGLALRARVDAKSSVITLPVRTTADKCVWAGEETLIAYCAVPQVLLSADSLDARLRGEGHTVDTWWQLDIRTGRAEILFPENMPQIDVENPVMDAEGKYVAFMNARDRSLWLLRLSK